MWIRPRITRMSWIGEHRLLACLFRLPAEMLLSARKKWNALSSTLLVSLVSKQCVRVRTEPNFSPFCFLVSKALRQEAVEHAGGIRVRSHDVAPGVDSGGVGVGGAGHVDRRENSIGQDKAVPDPASVIVIANDLTR